MSADRARESFDQVEARLSRLAERRPRLAFAASAVVGAIRNRLSRKWPATDEVEALFPHLGRMAALRLAARIGALEARNRVQVRCITRSGLAPLRPLVSVAGSFAALQAPCILATFHVGATHALAPALERLTKPVLALRLGSLAAPRPPVEMLTTEGGEQQRAAVFHRAILQLERGGFVVMAVDVVPGAWVDVTCLGRPLRLARGPFALSRLSGAPIVPLVSRWSRRGVHVIAADPLQGAQCGGHAGDGTDSEQALADAAAVWLERYLLDAPSELGLGLLRSLLYGLNPP